MYRPTVHPIAAAFAGMAVATTDPPSARSATVPALTSLPALICTPHSSLPDIDLAQSVTGGGDKTKKLQEVAERRKQQQVVADTEVSATT
ncbi:hypothetical protein [Kribbella sp. CA-293567]|uniref:hypothetical protein n=1 Tax=Kribbella sp. CA-293567 TaxID=3002436 RepID=UPI0022DE5E01|nr:hypothetical protein [Kribbella sp. CA-293567]WBQ07361.1 hypothetical protein OX958_11285 [Kribbella sp. CA-293567]